MNTNGLSERWWKTPCCVLPTRQRQHFAWSLRLPSSQVTLAVRVEGFGWSDAVTLPLPPPARNHDGGSPEPGTAARCDAQSTETSAANPASQRDAKPPQQLWLKHLGAGSRMWRRGAQGRAENANRKVHVGLRDAQGGELRVNAEVALTASGLRQVRCCK